ncbi:E3 ubiquitin-protein ligase RNFT1 isoform X2 [Antechinus flavipes]|uniref:E3 ubiquitin-protein ligase RNFT1 isoform X2 n=1 Tax=Antechinus flavipes TaxID=38775 RepID=UPI002236A3CE|nr:E3 ubiquitin-protein ligase RNFT1 isoform X2 [Antechinus flavipes]
MQTSCSHLHNLPGTGGSEAAPVSHCAHSVRMTGEGACHHPGEIHIQISSVPGECGESLSPRNLRSASQSNTQGCIHSRVRSHSHNEARQPDDATMDPGENGSSSISEFRYLFRWLQKSLPYILILCVKLVMQHITGISLGIGLLTTFMYANKSIVNQVFLRERCSKVQCACLLVFLAGSSILLYYTFQSQSLYYSLIFLNPTLDFLSFWEVLWIVGITDFILKFLFMGFKCLILLVPSFVISFKSKGYWYMLIEELCQYYRTFVPIPVWFRYLVSYGELGGSVTGWSLGILLGLLYLILKLLDFFGHLRTFRRALRIFLTRPSYGVTASKRQCSEADDLCSICQAEFQKPILLICQRCMKILSYQKDLVGTFTES